MLDFCGKNNIVSDIELVDAGYANVGFERMLKSDVKFRFVLDVGKTLNKDTKVQAPPPVKDSKENKQAKVEEVKKEECPIPNPLAHFLMNHLYLGATCAAVAGGIYYFMRHKN